MPEAFYADPNDGPKPKRRARRYLKRSDPGSGNPIQAGEFPDFTAGGEVPKDLTPEQITEALTYLSLKARGETNRLNSLKVLCQVKGMLKSADDPNAREPVIIFDDNGKKLLTLTSRKRKEAA